MKDRINIEGRDGAFAAYIARPKTIPAPAVVGPRLGLAEINGSPASSTAEIGADA